MFHQKITADFLLNKSDPRLYAPRIQFVRQKLENISGFIQASLNIIPSTLPEEDHS